VKVLLWTVALAVVAIIAGTVYVGLALREETVVADPYEAGLRWDAEHRASAAGSGSGAAPASARPAAAHGDAPGRCDLATASCTAPAGPYSVTLSLDPRPARTMAQLRVTAALLERGQPVEAADVSVAFAMAGMYMGENRVPLAPAGGGAYAGQAVLVRCPSGRRDWTAEVTVRRRGVPPASVAFALRVPE